MPALLESITNSRVQKGLLIIIVLIMLYMMRYSLLFSFSGSFFTTYLLPSLLWTLVALGIYFLMPKALPVVKSRYRKLFNWAAFLAALAMVIGMYAVSLFQGFGNSPYNHSFTGIIINILYLGTMLVGMELCRVWLLNYVFRKKPVFGVAFITLFFTIFAISPRRFFSLNTLLESAEFTGSIFLPALAENLVTTYLALLGGLIPAIIYRGTLIAFEWFMPVLPNLNWITTALLGTFIPAFSLVLIYQLYCSEVLRMRSKEKENPVGWILTSAVSVALIWFSLGVFNIFPNVIISGSMKPEIDIGDIVIVQSVEAKNVGVGDVIQFIELERSILINHRVIEIREDDRGLPLFITKGDANGSPDREPVIAEQLKGKVVQVLPKIGWVTIVLRSPG